MPPAKKRKTAAKAKGAKKDHVVTARASSPPPEETQPEPVEDAQPAPEPAEELSTRPAAPEPPTAPEKEPAATPSQDFTAASSTATTPAPAPPPAPTTTISDRQARLNALKNRSKASSAANLIAAQTEAHRLKHDPAQLNSLQRKSAVAEHKLRKADIEDTGGDFERKRAWDWTIDETEKWDERQKERQAHRDNNAFQDFGAEAGKVYDRQLRNLGAPDVERYVKQKTDRLEEMVKRGMVELVETEDGEVVAVDRDGTWYRGGQEFQKPDKGAIDRFLAGEKKNEEIVAKKRRERLARNGDDGDVTYINDKNKQFNQKLSRFYNKYTADIRDSFERGTMI